MTPAELFLRCFAELERRGIPSVVLHSYEEFPEHVASDVDCCVADHRLEAALACIRETAERGGWVVTQVLQHQVRAFYLVLANPGNPGHWLKLDLCSHYAHAHHLILRDSDLLHARRWVRGMPVPCPSSECIYMWAKIFAKGKDPAPYVPRLHQLARLDPGRTQELFAKTFGPESGRWDEWLERPVAEWRRLRVKMLGRTRYDLRWECREISRWLRRARHPTGVMLAFLGPDGVGKTTVITRLQPMLEPHFRQQLRVHFIRRPGAAAAGAPVPEPHRQPPRSVLVSWFKILFYFLCAWLDWLLRLYPARMRSTCIFCDRTFDDLLVDPRRYRVQGAAWLVRALRNKMPRPDLTFILDAPTNVIQKRKAEVRPEETEHQRSVLRQLAAGMTDWVMVPTTADPEAVSFAVWQTIIRFLARRQTQRGHARRLFARQTHA